MPALPANLPEETREVFARYLTHTAAPKAMLLQRVAHYLEVVLHASGEDEFVDLATARDIAHGLTTLLESAPDEHLPHIQAAVSYFVSSGDASPDLESILGFDDDAEVFNAVCHHLNRADLEISV